jgi:hypothetical protein
MVAPTPTIVSGIANDTTMMTDIIAEAMAPVEPSSDRTYTAGKNCIMELDRAVGAHRVIRSKMGSANHIVATKISVSRADLSESEWPLARFD